MPYAKNKIRVMVPKRSGFDKSHRNSGTMTVGTLTPILCDELIPGSRFSLKNNIAVQLPPLVSDTYMNLKLKVEAFFVPGRLLCGSFEDWFCDFPKRVYGRESGSVAVFKEGVPALPVFNIVGGDSGSFLRSITAPGSLLDYLGFKSKVSVGVDYSFNPLPLVAYHLIWQEWYRNPRVQNPCFSPVLPSGYAGDADVPHVWTIPSWYFMHSFGTNTDFDTQRVIRFDSDSAASRAVLADGVSIFKLRQRNFGLDYFTGSRVSAQQGPQSTINIELPEDPSDGASVSIAQIRAANSLQQFRERNNIPSPRMTDQVKARYNANLSDGVAQRPICIGSASYNVGTRGIDQTGANDSGNNPFNGVGAQYGRGAGLGSDYLVKDFTANEPGYVMVLASLVPEVTYSSGVAPMFKRYLSEGSITQMAVAQLQNMGDQPVFAEELLDTLSVGSSGIVFGFQDRFADFMFMPNEAHGEMRDGRTLDSFVLQRSFNSIPELSSSFLEIPKNYLDQVLVANEAISGFSAWYDTLLEYKVSMPLAEFSLPSLQDPAYEHGESVVLTRNGQIF